MTPVQPAKTRQGGAEGTQSASSDPLSLRSLRVGDEVWVVDSHREPYRTRVTSVGTKYIHTGHNKYRAIDGGCASGIGCKSIRTLAAYDRDTRVTAAKRALIGAGIDVGYGVADTKLLAIHDALKAAGLL